MKKYIKDMDELVNSTGYVFSYDPSKAAKGNTGPSGINWLVLFLAVASGAILHLPRNKILQTFCSTNTSYG